MFPRYPWSFPSYMLSDVYDHYFPNAFQNNSFSRISLLSIFPFRVIPCHFLSFRAISCRFSPFVVIACHFLSLVVILVVSCHCCHCLSFLVICCHLVTIIVIFVICCHFLSCHLLQFHVICCHLSPFLVMSCHLCHFSHFFSFIAIYCNLFSIIRLNVIWGCLGSQKIRSFSARVEVYVDRQVRQSVLLLPGAPKRSASCRRLELFDICGTCQATNT